MASLADAYLHTLFSREDAGRRERRELVCACRLGQNKKWTKPYRGDQIRAYRDIFNYPIPRAFADMQCCQCAFYTMCT